MVITPEITKTPKKRKNKKPPSLSKNTHWGALALISLLTLIGYLLIVSEAAAHGLETQKLTEALYAPVAKAEPEKQQSPTPDPIVPVKALSSPIGGSQNEARIREIAKEMGLTKEQTDRAVKIGYCESGLVPKQSQNRYSKDHPEWGVKKGDQELSFGIFQIHIPSNRNVTVEKAMNVDWASRWALTKMKNGYWRLWTCNKLIN